MTLLRILISLSIILMKFSPFAGVKINMASDRITKVINSQWIFNYFPAEDSDHGYEAPGFDDSAWSLVSIPHTWSTYETTGDIHPFVKNTSENDDPYWWTGWGWYRKHFSISTAYSAKKVFVEFEGVQKYCKVWINGKYLGDHKGGYGSFDFDITEYILPGKDNVLAVAVNNLLKDKFAIPPMAAGYFDVYGGIYRDVSLVIKDKLYIPMQGSASHEGGTFVTTPEVSEKEGIVRIQTWVQNDSEKAEDCNLNTIILDSDGKVVGTIKSKNTIAPGQLFKFDQTSKGIKKPHLWSCNDPYLYKVVSVVSDGSGITDSYESPLGFRWFRWEYKENFLYVNDKKMIIRGGNRHQDYPWLGDAVPKWITEMDLKDIAENLNYNFLRTSNYPNDRLVYELADKYGIVIDEELPDIGDQMFSPVVREQQVKEMIRRDRNHPGIMFWGMGDETDHAVNSKFAVEEDTTRIITARRVMNGSAGTYVRLTEDNLELENLDFCTIRGWFGENGKRTGHYDKNICETENDQQDILEASGLFGTGNLCVWLYADHGSDREYLDSPLTHITPGGYVDAYRVPKYGYYFWQAVYSDKPVVFIQPHYWRSKYLGQRKNIIVNSNCDRVELFVNGTSKGSQAPDRSDFYSISFEGVTVEKGTLSAVAEKDGQSITTQVVMAGDPARLVLKASHQKIDADRADVVIVTADIIDAEGNHVYGANNTVKWAVSGPATLAGPAEYRTDINKDGGMEGVWYMDMPVSNVIRSTGVPGNIRVTLHASGLASASLDIEAQPVKNDNSVISEPVPDSRGRNPVTRPTLKLFRLEEPYKEIKDAQSGFRIPVTDREGYAKIMSEYILKNNPHADTASIEFKTLTDLLADHLINNKGVLSADDYNYDIDPYNNCRLITKNIDVTKLPQLFKDCLKGYYAEAIIREGNEKDPGNEVNWLNWIPSGGTVVISQEEPEPVWPKGTIVTAKTGLADLIEAVYPVFVTYDKEARDRALSFISKMNPYVHIRTAGNRNITTDITGKSNVSYVVDQGKPILIPLIKFITR